MTFDSLLQFLTVFDSFWQLMTVNPDLELLKGISSWTKLIVNMVQVIFLKPNFLSDAGMELTWYCAQMKAENM